MERVEGGGRVVKREAGEGQERKKGILISHAGAASLDVCVLGWVACVCVCVRHLPASVALCCLCAVTSLSVTQPPERR